jgi:hypothetical protein
MLILPLSRKFNQAENLEPSNKQIQDAIKMVRNQNNLG